MKVSLHNRPTRACVFVTDLDEGPGKHFHTRPDSTCSEKLISYRISQFRTHHQPYMETHAVDRSIDDRSKVRGKCEHALTPSGAGAMIPHKHKPGLNNCPCDYRAWWKAAGKCVRTPESWCRSCFVRSLKVGIGVVALGFSLRFVRFWLARFSFTYNIHVRSASSFARSSSPVQLRLAR